MQAVRPSSETMPAAAAPGPGAVEVPPRIVTATALYDGHDASINLVRRLCVAKGAEVVHLGHDRSAAEIAKAALEEDASAVCVSSYQGGHMEFFPYLRSLLDQGGAPEVLIFGGGGGVILPGEAEELQERGIEKIFTPEDGRRLGLEGMGSRIVEAARAVLRASQVAAGAAAGAEESLARRISRLEWGASEALAAPEGPAAGHPPGTVVVGITGTGGAGKSSLCDELLVRFANDFPSLRVAVLAVDPTKRLTGGALLGDRLRMNAVYRPEVFLRSLATRSVARELAPAVGPVLALLAEAGFPVILVETTGIGQGGSAITEVADVSLYVMTSDFGGPTQLEKIDMLDFADLIAVNKADRRGTADALRLVEKQARRSGRKPAPAVVATTASRFNDPGVNQLYRSLLERLAAKGFAPGPPARTPAPASGDAGSSMPAICTAGPSVPAICTTGASAPVICIVPPARLHYLSEAAEAVRRHRTRTRADVEAVRRVEHLEGAARLLAAEKPPAPPAALEALEAAAGRARAAAAGSLRELEEWEATRRAYGGDTVTYRVRERDVSVTLRRSTISGLAVPRVALPAAESRAEILRFLREENLPGRFPYTAGVFPFKRDDELPTRQFAGEGTPERTNRRFHLLCDAQPARRLSVAFDSVTLYGADPDERPDIYGKVGTSGVSIATLNDMRKLFQGFDLLDPATSVSMTINGPAPIILAMFFNAAIEQQVDAFRARSGREPAADERERLEARVLSTVRGTVQADILKEVEAQNTCIFSTEFALKMMGDVQEYFIARRVENYYSISISGYHIAEAGANPITQLAFTLANGLTYLEYYKGRGMAVDDFAPNFSFFFSNGLDAEYGVLGRVARRIWAVVLRSVHGASERSQKLKYHIQTSGRSLHAREISFNDIRTTLQALLAVYDHCNSLHTNAYDEAITTPTAESVRRALAIQLIVQRELGMAKNENPLQGSYIVRELTDLVEEAVLAEFERLSERGGVPGALESGYLRGRIQDESMRYEEMKEAGEMPIIGVNTFLDPAAADFATVSVPVVRSTEEEKREQIRNLRAFQARHRGEAPRALARLRETALGGGNLFAELMECVRHASLGQIAGALYAVGGKFRRSI